jgi:phospholipase C
VQAFTRLRHIIVIMQENRSFDSYFGTFPGAEGSPMQGTRGHYERTHLCDSGVHVVDHVRRMRASCWLSHDINAWHHSPCDDR